MGLELIRGDRVIAALKPWAGRLSDGGGLYLLPAATGDRHGWRFDYSFEGKRQTISLGVYPAVGLKLARERAQIARAQVAAGINPSTERKQQRAADAEHREAKRRARAGEPALGSFEEVARRWFDVTEPRWVAGYSSKVIRRLEIHVFPYLGQRAIASIQPPDVLEVCRRIEDQGAIESAHRALEHCSNVFRFAIAEGILGSDPCRDLRGALRKPRARAMVRAHPSVVAPSTTSSSQRHPIRMVISHIHRARQIQSHRRSDGSIVSKVQGVRRVSGFAEQAYAAGQSTSALRSPIRGADRQQGVGTTRPRAAASEHRRSNVGFPAVSPWS